MGAPSAFPDLEPLDDVSAILEAATGALTILAGHLQDNETNGTAAPLTAYAVGHLLDHARRKTDAINTALCGYRRALG
jgi:hypothetical protein